MIINTSSIYLNMPYVFALCSQYLQDDAKDNTDQIEIIKDSIL